MKLIKACRFLAIFIIQ